MKKKDKRIKNGLWLICLAVLPATASISAHGEEEVISTEEIRRSVVEAEATRAWPKTRAGYVFENSRSLDADDRSIEIVADTVRVDPDAHISLPITFALDSSTELTGNSSRQLEALANALKGMKEGESYLIEGHTCVLGETDHNNRLSIARANFIVHSLIQRGVPARSLRAMGCGPAEAVKDGVSDDASEVVLAPYRKVMIHRTFTSENP